jgi:hypothetical protein
MNQMDRSPMAGSNCRLHVTRVLFCQLNYWDAELTGRVELPTF